MVEELARGFADELRRDLAPTARLEDIRILESRDGIAKADHARFKAAIRQTKNDVAGACAAFDGLLAAYPDAVSLIFNVGLCHESAGELAEASGQYQAALALSPRKLEPQEGLGRIVSRLRAEQQLSIHYGDGGR